MKLKNEVIQKIEADPVLQGMIQRTAQCSQNTVLRYCRANDPKLIRLDVLKTILSYLPDYGTIENLIVN
jgi:hypothetical protein